MVRHNTGWLWWLSLVIAGGATAAVLYIHSDAGYINAEEAISKVIMFAFIAIGICVISATSHWWINR